MIKSTDDRPRAAGWGRVTLALCLLVSTAHAQTRPCTGGAACTWTILDGDGQYQGPAVYAEVGDVMRNNLHVFSADGKTMRVNRLRWAMDCAYTGESLDTCTDQGPVVAYLGDSTITTDCPGVTWTSNSPGGGSHPNTLIFTPSPQIVVPAGAGSYCMLSFDTQVMVGAAGGWFSPFMGCPQEVDAFACPCDGGGSSGFTDQCTLFVCPSCACGECNRMTGQCEGACPEPEPTASVTAPGKRLLCECEEVDR